MDPASGHMLGGRVRPCRWSAGRTATSGGARLTKAANPHDALDTAGPAEPVHDSPGRVATFLASADGRLAGLTIIAIALHMALSLVGGDALPWWVTDVPLILVVVGGGGPLVVDVLRALLRWAAGTDLLAAVSIIASVALGEWLVGSIIVLMMSGGEALGIRGHGTGIPDPGRVGQAEPVGGPPVARRGPCLGQ